MHEVLFVISIVAVGGGFDSLMTIFDTCYGVYGMFLEQGLVVCCLCTKCI